MTWTPERAARVRARAEAATEKPWAVDLDDATTFGESVMCPVVTPGGNHLGACADCGVRPDFTHADAEFIAHARTDIPDMLDEIDRLTQKLSAMQARIMADVDPTARASTSDARR